MVIMVLSQRAANHLMPGNKSHKKRLRDAGVVVVQRLNKIEELPPEIMNKQDGDAILFQTWRHPCTWSVDARNIPIERHLIQRSLHLVDTDHPTIAHRIQASNQVLLRLTNAAITRRNTTLVEERRKFFNFKLKSQANASLQSSETLEKKKWKLEKSRQHLDELILHRDFYTVMCGEFHLFAGERIEESTSSNRVDFSTLPVVGSYPVNLLPTTESHHAIAGHPPPPGVKYVTSSSNIDDCPHKW